MRVFSLVMCLVAIGMLFGACARPKGDTPQEKRNYVLQMKSNALAKLYAQKPYAKVHRFYNSLRLNLFCYRYEFYFA